MNEMQEIIELNLVDFMSLALKYPNDIDFGKNCRGLFPYLLVNKTFPNDMDLGKWCRKFLQKIQK